MAAAAFPAPLMSWEGDIPENWVMFKQQYENYEVLMDIKTKNKEYRCAAFLHCVGQKGLKIYNSLQFAEAQDDIPAEDKKDVNQLLTKFDQQIIGTLNETYERFKFNKRDQHAGETIDDYVSALRELAKNCRFEALHDSLLRDRIVLGITEPNTRKVLLQKRDLTLILAIDICRGAEATQAQLASMGQASKENVCANKMKYKGYQQRIAKPSDAKPTADTAKSATIVCKFCGYEHELDRKKCPAVDKKCMKCGGTGHFARKCCSKTHSNQTKVHYVEADSDVDSDVEYIDIIKVNAVSDPDKAAFAELTIDGDPVPFQIDCGSTVNLLPRKYIGDRHLEPCRKTLVMWNTSESVAAGKCRLTVHNPTQNRRFSVEFVVMNENNFTPILGMKTSEKMNLITIHRDQFKSVHVNKVHVSAAKDGLIQRYQSVFDGGLGKLEGTVHLHVDPDAQPVSMPARPVPVSIRDKVKAEIYRLVDKEVLAPMDEPSEWTNQFVATTKKNGDIRICIDPQRLNQALMRERYKMPTLDELLPDLSEAKVFTKVDLSSAYWHLVLDDDSSKLTAMITPFGRFRWLRLPFGLNVSGEIFQKRIHQALEGLPGIVCKADDAIIYGRDDAQHDANLECLLQRCVEKGIKLNPDKLELRASEISFDGHLMTSAGLKIDPEKATALLEMPEPKDVVDVQRLNGMVNYLSRFLPHLTDVMKPIRDLTHKDVEWCWTDEHQKAFVQLKVMMTSTPVLAYYDVKQDLEIQCDSSQSGLGAVLMQGGRPISYASRALIPAETRYAQIEKEALAIVFAVEKFHEYTFGKRVKVYSDHKPLEAIMKKDLSRAPRRLQRMIIRLQNYDLDVVYMPGCKLFIADTLSRAYLPYKGHSDTEFETVNMAQFLPIREERLAKIRAATQSDETMQALSEVILSGWPDVKDSLPVSLVQFFSVRDEFSVQDGLVFRGERVMIPESLRKTMVEKVHTSHMGIEGCLRRARECMYWPKMSEDVKKHVSACEICCTFNHAQPKETLSPSEIPQRPWQRVASDLFTWNNAEYIVTVDFYSDFYELDKLASTSSSAVIKVLKRHFSRHGIPEQLVTDNGPQYVSEEFERFAQEWDFEHLTISPYNSKANGKAESAVKKAKTLLRKIHKCNGDLQLALLEQRNIPSESSGTSPVMRLMNRRTRTLLPVTANLLIPRSIDAHTERMKLRDSQLKQKYYYDKHAHDLPVLEEGDTVRIKPVILGQKAWQKGQVTKRLDERSYEVTTPSGIYRRNRMHLRKTEEPATEPDKLNTHDRSLQDFVCDSQNNVPPMEQTPLKSPITVSMHETPVKAPRPQRNKMTPGYLRDYVAK